jgi:hypothetical protein
MRQIPKAKTKNEVEFIFEHLCNTGDEDINCKEVILFYLFIIIIIKLIN